MKKTFALIVACSLLLLNGCGKKSIDFTYGDNYILEIGTNQTNTAYKADPGTYKFSVHGEPQTAGIYDIYVRDSVVSYIEDLGTSDFSVGGISLEEFTVTLNEGDLVYIVPYTGINYEQSGWLVVEKQ